MPSRGEAFPQPPDQRAGGLQLVAVQVLFRLVGARDITRTADDGRDSHRLEKSRLGAEADSIQRPLAT